MNYVSFALDKEDYLVALGGARRLESGDVIVWEHGSYVYDIDGDGMVRPWYWTITAGDEATQLWRQITRLKMRM